LLLAAERFDAVAAVFGAKTKTRLLERAWRDLLASQSHDVGLCEYSRWQGDRMAPIDRIEDLHNFTWGNIGYNHLDAAQRQGESVLTSALGYLVNQIGADKEPHGHWAVTVFNPQSWQRSSVVMTERIYLSRQKARNMMVKDRLGRIVPAQFIQREVDGQGNLVVAKMAFLASQVPSVGYDTYYLEATSETPPAPATDLHVDESKLVMENQYVQVKLDPKTGAISSLIAKATGQEMLGAPAGAFPRFKGRPNPNYPLRSIFGSKNAVSPFRYDSAKSQADLRWMEKGPLRAILRAKHRWPLMRFETHVTLSAASPYVEVVSRILAEVPPAPDTSPAVIKEGYWLSFGPSFQPTSVFRDFPFGIEPTVHRDFHALTLVDLVNKDSGLLVLHAGTQYFHLDDEGQLANLVMREWESFWTGEYGWPRYSEYRHALMPHGADFGNEDRVRAATEFGQQLFNVIGPPKSGPFPKSKSFMTLAPRQVHLSALRKLSGPGSEIRLVEVSGQPAAVNLQLGWPATGAVETNLLGRKLAEATCNNGQLLCPMKPWQIRTFKLI
jgi:alpha-mannosidase